MGTSEENVEQFGFVRRCEVNGQYFTASVLWHNVAPDAAPNPDAAVELRLTGKLGAEQGVTFIHHLTRYEARELAAALRWTVEE